MIKIKNNTAISDTGFIFVPTTGDSFSMNPIGVEIINLLKQGKTEKDIKKHILSVYEVDDASFEKDFYDFINQLKQHNLVDIDK